MSEEVVIRPARRDESSQLADLFARVAIESSLHLSVERHPDFYALYDIEHDPADQLVIALETGGAIEGIGAGLARDAHLGGRRARVGYAADLRLTPKIRGGKFLGTYFPGAFRQMCEELGCEVMYTVVFDSNRAAQQALVARSDRWPDKPIYRSLRRFTIQSVQLAHPRPARRTGLRVSIATDAEMDEVLAFLQRDHRQRPFGYILDEGQFERRLRQWPRFGSHCFYLARDGSGALRGTVAVWDAVDVKRYRVLGYRGSMKWIKRLYDPFARLVGGTPLPGVGEHLRYFYLTHVSVADTAAMVALVDRVYADHRKLGYHFFTVYVPHGDPIRQVFRGYFTTGLGAQLFTMTAPDSPLADVDFGPGLPGFEMALA